MSKEPQQRQIFHQPSKSPRRTNRVLGPLADALVAVTAGMRVVSGIVIVIIMLVTGYDVIMRYIFAKPLEWSLPVSMLGLVVIVMFAVPNIAAQRSHIAMDLFYRKFSARGKLVADIITNTATLLFSMVVGLTAAGASANFLTGGLRTSGNFNLPVWIDYAVVAVGLLVLALVVILMPWQTRTAQNAEETDEEPTDTARGGNHD
ncbi:TRAP transporter small permease [Brevibacterium marinum]|uniref:TRAP-type C4-dicarboxylate transport system permease small subunit n=1 Tax=Brevibacterium marinum TaxID=418643 RepID=A0A846RX37_9MICO|nr:TRAP transporter small permease [Brevibacterium marinum]NJC56005.1 TRAP-type C4-dicarboxylate transport system permease small subunit [Brevibacterium marinum]